MQFELLRLSLVERRQLPLFPDQRQPTRQTREEWLRATLTQPIAFSHRTETFHYVPAAPTAAIGGLIVGRIGRRVTLPENKPPEGGFAPIAHEAWRAALVIVDPTHHDDGQKVAVEHLASVGLPVPIFESLAAKINAADGQYILESNAIVPTEAFWDFVKKNEGQITKVEFEFVAPNMFGEADDYDREMREMHEQEKAQKARLALESKDGLNLETAKIRRAVDYANKGAGSIKARTKKRTKYNSRDKAKKVNIANKLLDPSSPLTLISRIVGIIFPP